MNISRIKKAFGRTTSYLALFIGLGIGAPSAAQAQAQPSFFPVTPPVVNLPLPQPQPVSAPPANMEDFMTQLTFAFSGGPPAPIQQDNALIIEFSRTQLGRDLLAFAADNKISIVFDGILKITRSCGVYTHSSKRVALNPGLNIEDQIITLAHELWHARQHVLVGYPEIRSSLINPQYSWAMSRFLESDSYSFSSYFVADRMMRLGITDVAAPNSETEVEIAKKLLHEMTLTQDGLTLREYRKIAFEHFLRVLPLCAYKDAHIKANNIGVNSLELVRDFARQDLDSCEYKDARDNLKKLREYAFTAPSKTRMDKVLRKFGSISVDPKAKTCMQDRRIKKETLLDVYPFLYAGSKDKREQECGTGVLDAFRETARRQAVLRSDILKLADDINTAEKQHKKQPRDRKAQKRLYR